MKAREEFFVPDVLERLASMSRNGNWDIDREEANELLTWLLVVPNRFARQKFNGTSIQDDKLASLLYLVNGQLDST